MESETYRLDWKGPFQFWGGRESCLFFTTHGLEAGVYIWTALVKDEHWAYYVGETAKSFAVRHLDHLKSYYSGEYRIFNAKEFSSGRKIAVWSGAFGKKNRNRLSEFKERSSELLKELQEFTYLLSFFLVTLNENRRIRQRLEAALALELQKQDGPAAQFQDDDIRYAPTRGDERPISFEFTSSLPIVGLSRKRHIRTGI